MNVSSTKSASQMRRLLAVFAIAFVIRLVYNLYIAQHRILDVGDSFYYLSAGRALAKLVSESQSIQYFLQQLCSSAKFIPGSFNSFSSLNLSDRLLIDGPVYPSYLASVFLLTGKALETTALNTNQIVFGLANSFVDSILAVVVACIGEMAFGLWPGLLAGLLWAFYPPAIVNTQQCYGEPVVALLLAVFTALLFGLSRKKAPTSTRFIFSLFMGLLAGLVMLATPAFIFLPPLLLVVQLIALALSKRLRSMPCSLASIFLGLMLALAPWLLYTGTVSGAPCLVVNRAPSYNLYIGNYLPTDGWKTWPVVGGVPDSVADAREFIAREAGGKFWPFVSLLLRKIPRLWAGVWNDFHLSTFGFSYFLQNILQAFYLLLATLAGGIFFAGKLLSRRPFSFAATFTLAWIIAYHFIYVLFEPVPRYAFTAMPAVIVLAAAATVRLLQLLAVAPKKVRIKAGLQILFLLGFAKIVSAALYAFKTPVPALLWLTQDPSVLRLLSGLILLIWYVLLAWLFHRNLVRLNIRGPISTLVLFKTFILSGLIALAGALSDPAYLEWYVALPSANRCALETSINVPELGTSVPSKIFLLVDVQSESGAPALDISVNYKSATTYPLPLYELSAAAKDIPGLLNLQTRMMDIDQRTSRQWWVYPVDSSLFKFGAENIITLVPIDNHMKIFGDYTRPLSSSATGGFEVSMLPSLTSFSWSKGFLTADCRDPRVYEEASFRGKAGETRAVINDHSATLVPGAARVRLAVPMLGAAEPIEAYEKLKILSVDDERKITGQNPVLFDSPAVHLTAPPAPSSIFHLRAQLRRDNKSVPATMALTLDSGDGNPPYTPIWQPSCIRLSDKWQSFDFKTILPPTIKYGREIKAHLLLSPFPGDRLYLHRKEALRDSIEVRNLKIEIMPPAVPGGGASGALKLI